MSDTPLPANPDAAKTSETSADGDSIRKALRPGELRERLQAWGATQYRRTIDLNRVPVSSGGETQGEIAGSIASRPLSPEEAAAAAAVSDAPSNINENAALGDVQGDPRMGTTAGQLRTGL